MSRIQKEPLRALRPEERSHLERVSRALGLPAALVARAKVLLAVANGHAYIEATHLAGRRTGDVAALVKKALIEQAYTEGSLLGLGGVGHG